MPDATDIKGLMVNCLQDLYGNETVTIQPLPLIIDPA